MEIGAAIRVQRERAGLSVVQVARAIGHHRATVTRWETGASNPKPADRHRLCGVLGVEYDRLFPTSEAAVIVAARCVVGARTIPDLQRAVARLSDELAAL